MTAANKWSQTGRVKKNSLLTVRATLTSKGSQSATSLAENDWLDFICTSKSLPSFAAGSTWTHVLDDANEITGRAYVGKPEQMSQIDITTETPIVTIYHDLLGSIKGGDVYELVWTYDDPLETNIYKICVSSCQIVNVAPEAGETNAGSTTTISFQPEGGTYDNLPKYKSWARSGGSEPADWTALGGTAST